MINHHIKWLTITNHCETLTSPRLGWTFGSYRTKIVSEPRICRTLFAFLKTADSNTKVYIVYDLTLTCIFCHNTKIVDHELKYKFENFARHLFQITEVWPNIDSEPVKITSELCKFLSLKLSQVSVIGGSIAPVTNGTIVMRLLVKNIGEIIFEMIILNSSLFPFEDDSYISVRRRISFYNGDFRVSCRK